LHNFSPCLKYELFQSATSSFFSFSLFFIKKSRERKERSKEKKEREKILINPID